MADDSGYLLDNRQVEAGMRFDALSTLFNPSTFRHLGALGIAEGWRCWEVAAGGASVPSWLGARVGPTGHVLATDIDVTWMTADAGYEVRSHDVGVRAAAGKRIRPGTRATGADTRPAARHGTRRHGVGAAARRLEPAGGGRSDAAAAGLPGRVRPTNG